MLIQLADFLNLFRTDIPTFTEFSNSVGVLEHNTEDNTAIRPIRDFLSFDAKKPQLRLASLPLYLEKLYRILVVDRVATLTWWFERYAALNGNVSDYFALPSYKVESPIDGVIGKEYTALPKSFNFLDLYKTQSKGLSTLGLIVAMYNQYALRNSMACPAYFDQILRYDGSTYALRSFWFAFMMGARKPSVFNPVTYLSILNTYFSGTTLLAPTMDWHSYQLAFYSSQFDHFIGIDVIPSVIKRGHWLHAQQPTDKTIDLRCEPSELVDLSIYRNSVDAVLFSPPYFDLERYPSSNQSVTNYPTYNDWLINYWRKTVKTCRNCLRPGGRLGFVVSNSVQLPRISEDLAEICSMSLRPIEKLKIKWQSWGKFNARMPAKMREGNFEDLWLFEKPICGLKI